jgi:hypothetical protein
MAVACGFLKKEGSLNAICKTTAVERMKSICLCPQFIDFGALHIQSKIEYFLAAFLKS